MINQILQNEKELSDVSGNSFFGRVFGRKTKKATRQKAGWQRRCGDLNPGAACATYRISSADPSTTWVHLHSVLYSIGKLMILQVFYRAKFDVFKAVKCKIRDLMFERGDVRIRII